VKQKLDKALAWVQANFGVIASATLFLALLLASILEFPTYLVNRTIARGTEQPKIAERLKAENDIRTTLLQGLGGLVLLFGAFTALRQYYLSQEGQVTERFTKAIDQLGSETLAVCLGGIYALERIAKDSARDRGPIMEVLTAFVRERARWKDDQAPPADGQSPKPSADIQAILTVLGRRVIDEKWREPPHLDLSNTDLRGAILTRAHLERAFLVGAHLQGADLRGAHLEGANLYRAHLEGAVLYEAHLEEAHLREAHLERAYLAGAHLQGADLYGAHLEGAVLHEAHLENADLRDAHLENAVLTRAHLERAYLVGAHLQGADLRGAHLEEAHLPGADLEEAYIGGAHLKWAVYTKEQIDSAYTDREQWQQARAKRLQSTRE
jgi:uncharacterized protein YjbI with pentapeptide repeats